MVHRPDEGGKARSGSVIRRVVEQPSVAPNEGQFAEVAPPCVNHAFAFVGMHNRWLTHQASEASETSEALT